MTLGGAWGAGITLGGAWGAGITLGGAWGAGITLGGAWGAGITLGGAWGAGITLGGATGTGACLLGSWSDWAEAVDTRLKASAAPATPRTNETSISEISLRKVSTRPMTPELREALGELLNNRYHRIGCGPVKIDKWGTLGDLFKINRKSSTSPHNRRNADFRIEIDRTLLIFEPGPVGR
jgi:hypothetical protein